MLLMNEVQRVLYGAVGVGELFLGFGYEPGSQLLLCAGLPADGRQLFSLPHLSPEGLDDEDVVLRLREPQVRFDPESAVALDQTPPTGTLLMLQGGPAVYRTPRNSTARGDAVTFDGRIGPVYRDSSIPAFTKWDVGVMRSGAFVPVEQFDVA